MLIAHIGAIGILHPLLYPEIRLESEGAVVQAHRMLGVAHLFENRPDDARREFRKLLELRPDYRAGLCPGRAFHCLTSSWKSSMGT